MYSQCIRHVIIQHRSRDPHVEHLRSEHGVDHPPLSSSRLSDDRKNGSEENRMSLSADAGGGGQGEEEVCVCRR